jgi:TolB-like protein/DNA-binding winged helix-turn-helix (wHTH) protein/Tfp pilus assembly protein PilF
MDRDASSPDAPHAGYVFGEFTLDLDRGELLGPRGDVKLRPKSYEVLRYLVEHHGRLVTKDELLVSIWGRMVVTEDSLTQCVVEIRRALGQDARRMLRTVPRRGYMLDTAVTRIDGDASEPADTVTADVGAAHGEPPMAPPVKRWSALAAVAVAAAALALALAWWGLGERDAGAPERSEVAVQAAPNGIAVLPFVDMSAEQDQGYFGEGIAEEILNLLAQSRQLRVIARTSSFSFRDPSVDITSIAARLGVAHVLEGSVRKSGDRVRVTAQLVDARNSAHLWSQTYDRELGDILAVQSDIAGSVAGVLRATLDATPGEAAEPPHDPHAYDLVLRGRHLFNRRGPGDTERARAHFEAALEIEPDYAQAWVGLAGAWWVLLNDYAAPPEVAMPAFIAAVDRALELDPDLPEAHLRAMNARYIAGDEEAAWEHMRIAEALDPDNQLLLAMKAGWWLAHGALDDAVALQRRAVAIDPLVANDRFNLVHYLLGAGRLEEARDEIEMARELAASRDVEFESLESQLLILEGHPAEALALMEPWSQDERTAWLRAIARHALGESDEVAAIESRLREASTPDAAEGLAALHVVRGQPDEAFEWLAEWRRRLIEESLLKQDWRWRQLSHTSPFLRPLRDDPRWAALHAK